MKQPSKPIFSKIFKFLTSREETSQRKQSFTDLDNVNILLILRKTEHHLTSSKIQSRIENEY